MAFRVRAASPGCRCALSRVGTGMESRLPRVDSIPAQIPARGAAQSAGAPRARSSRGGAGWDARLIINNCFKSFFLKLLKKVNERSWLLNIKRGKKKKARKKERKKKALKRAAGMRTARMPYWKEPAAGAGAGTAGLRSAQHRAPLRGGKNGKNTPK